MDIQDVLPQDAIPDIDDPAFDMTYFGDPDDEVIVVKADPPRAYPVRVLSYHEIINDVLEATESAGADERPIAVTWCPICASAVVYDRTVDGQTLTFGTSGKLADDALVMYDRETESEWKQPLGTAISGPLEGRELSVMPSSILTWGQFRTAYPDGVVLQPVRGSPGDRRGNSPREVYDMTPYERYDADPAFGLRAMRGEGPRRTWGRTDIDAKTTVIGVVRDGDTVGYPVPQIRAAGGVVTDTVGGLDIVVVASSDTAAHAFENPGYDFELRDGALYGDGVAWDLATGQSSDGRHLIRVPSRRLYAFAWQDDHGAESFYGLD